jgi:hypothetical protein
MTTTGSMPVRLWTDMNLFKGAVVEIRSRNGPMLRQKTSTVHSCFGSNIAAAAPRLWILGEELPGGVHDGPPAR